MNCILCSLKKDETKDIEFYGLSDFNEETSFSGIDLIEKYLPNLAKKILTEELLNSLNSSLCSNCWNKLDEFHEFASLIEQNYYVTAVALNEQEAENILENAARLKNSVSEIEEDDEYSRSIRDLISVRHQANIVESESEVNWIEIGEEIAISALQPENINEEYSRISENDNDEDKIFQTVSFICNICNHYKFKNFKDAKRHMKKVHEIDGYVECCNRKFRQRIRLIEHITTVHFGHKISCEVCQKKFDSRNYYIKHKAVHQNIKNLECDLCEKTFATKFQIRSHLLNVHILHSYEKTLKCHFNDCVKKFVNQARLNHHVKYFHTVKLETIQCYICEKTFKQKSSYDAHIKIHSRTTKNRIKCGICGHYLADVKTFKRHMKNHATEDHDNSCPYCGKKAPNKNALMKHIQYVHKKSSDYKCEYCMKSFKRQRDMQDHTASIHTLQDIYACEFCSRRFRNYSNMLTHRKKNHPKEYKKPVYLRDNI